MKKLMLVLLTSLYILAIAGFILGENIDNSTNITNMTNTTNSSVLCLDSDSDGFDICNLGEEGDDFKKKDCNDNNSLIYPSSKEILDNLDNNCNLIIDEGFVKNINKYPVKYEGISNSSKISCDGNSCFGDGSWLFTIYKEVENQSGNESIVTEINIAEFKWDADESLLDFDKIVVNQGIVNNLSFIILSGFENVIKNGSTKTAYLKNLNNYQYICIFDSNNIRESDFSKDCSGANETKIKCDGKSSSGYSCSAEEGGSQFKIKGLLNSGVIEFNYTEPSSSSSNSGGGGNAGARRAGSRPYSKAIGDSCETFWTCSEWGECSQGIQIRNCQKVLPSCAAIEKPEEVKACSMPGISNSSKNSADTNLDSQNSTEADGVTGAVSGNENISSASKRIIGIAAFVFLLFILFLIFRGRHSSEKSKKEAKK